MKNSKHLRGFAISLKILVLFILLGAGKVQAYNFPLCGLDPVVVSPAALPIHFDFYTKNFTSAQIADVYYAFDAWNNVKGMDNLFGGVSEWATLDQPPPFGPYFNIGGVPSYPGNNGISWWVWDHDNCSPSTPMIVAASTVLSTGIGLIVGNATCADDIGVALRFTALHELAHDIGFQHSTHPSQPSVVMATDDFRYCGGTDERIWLGVDDVRGGRDIYPGASLIKDLAGTSYEMDGTNDTNPLDCTSASCALPCPGNNITFEWTVASLGNQSSGNFNVRFYLSSNATIDSSDTLLSTNTGAFMPANSFAKFTKTVTIPAGTAHGSSWFVGWNLDWDNTVSERIENNNTGLLQTKITVCP